MKNRLTLSDKELEDMCDNIIAFEFLSKEEKDEYEWTVLLSTDNMSQNELFSEFTKNIINWYFYLKNKIEQEQYELAQKLKQVVEIEIKEFKSIIRTKYQDIYDELETVIDETNIELKQKFDI